MDERFPQFVEHVADKSFRVAMVEGKQGICSFKIQGIRMFLWPVVMSRNFQLDGGGGIPIMEVRLFYDAHAHCMCECCLEGIGYRAYGKRGEFYFYRSVATLVLKRDF